MCYDGCPSSKITLNSVNTIYWLGSRKRQTKKKKKKKTKKRDLRESMSKKENWFAHSNFELTLLKSASYRKRLMKFCSSCFKIIISLAVFFRNSYAGLLFYLCFIRKTMLNESDDVSYRCNMGRLTNQTAGNSSSELETEADKCFIASSVKFIYRLLIHVHNRFRFSIDRYSISMVTCILYRMIFCKWHKSN